MKSTPEVRKVVERTERIYEALRSAGSHGKQELVRNPNGESLAVISRKAFDPRKVTPSVALGRAHSPGTDTYDYATVEAARNTFPISGAKVYPKEYLDMVDIAIQAAVADTGAKGLAARLNGSTRGDDAFTKKGEGIGLHADFVGSTKYLETGLPLHGLNIHATRWGVAAARFGIVRRLEYDGDLVDIKRAVEENGWPRSREDEVYERVAAPFTEPVRLEPGDMLVFQAQQHTEQGIAAVAHDFATLTETRHSDIFTPRLGDIALVQAARVELATRLDLAAQGY